MKTVKAKFLSKYLMLSITVFHDLLVNSNPEDYEINGEEVFFNSPDFEKYYAGFLKELKEVISETKDIKLVRDYISSCLTEIDLWEGFIHNENITIFDNDDNISFKIELKKDIEEYTNLIKSFFNTDEEGYPIGLTDIYRNTLFNFDENEKIVGFDNKKGYAKIKYFRPVNKIIKASNKVSSGRCIYYEPTYDVRFNTKKMKAECDKLKSSYEKILFIHDRLNHFKQWQVQYDVEVTGEDSGKTYKFSSKFYPKFEELCKFEIQRLEGIMEYERKYNTPVKVDTETNPNRREYPAGRYDWNGTDTDLLELSIALLQTNSITRKDGKKMTHKELKEAFESMFGIEIKDAKVKLQNAVYRKKTTAPFLVNLVKAFEEYIKERKPITQ